MLLYSGLKAVFSQYKVVPKDRNTSDHIARAIRNRESHARGVYPTQDTSRMGTVKVKQNEDADT